MLKAKGWYRNMAVSVEEARVYKGKEEGCLVVLVEDHNGESLKEVGAYVWQWLFGGVSGTMIGGDEWCLWWLKV